MRRGGGGDAVYVGNQQQGETTQYLEENVSSDTQPESLDKGSVSLVTKRTLLALTDENAPAFREAFARGAIFTLSYPTQEHIDKLREILSLEPEQVIPDDAVDPHAEIYALTARHDGGGMIYEYIAVPSVNISVDLSSYDVTEELEEKGLLGVVSEDSEAPEVSDSFQAAEDTLPQASSADIAKQRAERFLEWTKNIDSLHESGIQSAEKVKAQFQSSFSENDIYGKSRQFDYANRYIVMRPQYEVYSWHSFEDRYNHDDFYYVRIRGGYSPSESEKKRTVPLVKLGYSSWYDLDTWFDTLTNSNVMLYQYDPENDNREYSYTNSRGINIGGNVGFTSNSQGDSTTIGGSAGINFSKSTTYKGYDYDIEDHSYSNGVNNARWIFRFKHPEYAWQNPSVVSRGTLRPKVEAVWRVKPDYYKNHGKSYILNFRHQGALGSTSLGVFLRHMDYGKSTYRDYMFVDAPPRIMAESTSIELPATFGNSYINITADEQCTATVFDSNWRMGTNWVAIMNSSRFSGNHQLMLYRFRNTSSSSRTAYIVLVGRETGAQVTIKVTQKGR